MKVKELLLTGLLVLLCAMPNVAMAADTTVTRSYPFESATQENPHYTVPETVEEGGKTYTLTSVEYEMKAHREPVTVVRTIVTGDPGDYPKQITETVDGTSRTLTAQTPTWATGESRTVMQEYASESEVPQSLTVDGVRLPLASVTAGTKTEAFSAPAVFQTSNPASRLYAIGDTVVTVGDAPLWDGWQAVMTAYLGLSGSSYTLTGGSWDGDFQQEGDNYTRMAIYTGTRQTPVWTATYQTEPEYTAEITYTDSQYPDGLYEMEAVATYTIQDTGSALETILKVGAGVLVVALAAAALPPVSFTFGHSVPEGRLTEKLRRCKYEEKREKCRHKDMPGHTPRAELGAVCGRIPAGRQLISGSSPARPQRPPEHCGG